MKSGDERVKLNMVSTINLVNTMKSAADEIQRLRQRNEVLQAIADTVAAFSGALSAPVHSKGYGIDVAWELRDMANKIDPAAAPAQAEAE